MTISFSCDCGARMKVPNDYGGKRGKCTGCQRVVRIPDALSATESSSGLTPVDLTESSAGLTNTLAPATDQGSADLEHERLALERAKLAYDLRKVERAREELDRARSGGQELTPAPASTALPAPVVNVHLPAQAHELAPESGTDLIDCPRCAEPIKAKAQVCKHCGHALTREEEKRQRRKRGESDRGGAVSVTVHGAGAAPPSPGVAALLAFFWMGLGHIYAGEIATGLMLMIGVPAVVGMALYVAIFQMQSGGAVLGVYLAIFLIWAWQLANAYGCAARKGRGTVRRRVGR